jgi:hypothetical protein
MNRPAGTEKPRSWKVTNPLGARNELVAGNPPLHSGGERRKLAHLDEMQQLLAGHIGACPVRHHGGKGSGGLKAQEVVALRMRRSTGSGMRARRKKKMGKQSPKPVPDAWFQRGKRGPSPSTSGPSCQRNAHPRVRALAKQAPTHTTPRSRQSTDLQRLHTVMMERSRPLRRPKCPRPLLRRHLP